MSEEFERVNAHAERLGYDIYRYDGYGDQYGLIGPGCKFIHLPDKTLDAIQAFLSSDRAAKVSSLATRLELISDEIINGLATINSNPAVTEPEEFAFEAAAIAFEEVVRNLDTFRAAVLAWGGKDNEQKLVALVEEYHGIQHDIDAELNWIPMEPPAQ